MHARSLIWPGPAWPSSPPAVRLLSLTRSPSSCCVLRNPSPEHNVCRLPLALPACHLSVSREALHFRLVFQKRHLAIAPPDLPRPTIPSDLAYAFPRRLRSYGWVDHWGQVPSGQQQPITSAMCHLVSKAGGTEHCFGRELVCVGQDQGSVGHASVSRYLTALVTRYLGAASECPLGGGGQAYGIKPTRNQVIRSVFLSQAKMPAFTTCPGTGTRGSTQTTTTMQNSRASRASSVTTTSGRPRGRTWVSGRACHRPALSTIMSESSTPQLCSSPLHSLFFPDQLGRFWGV